MFAANNSNLLQIWESRQEPGQVFYLNNGIAGILLTGAYSLLSNVIVTKLFVFLSYLAAGIGMYLLVGRWSHSRLAALFSSLFYILNIRILDHVYPGGHYSIVLAYGLAPFLFLFADRIMSYRRRTDIVILALEQIIV